MSTEVIEGLLKQWNAFEPERCKKFEHFERGERLSVRIGPGHYRGIDTSEELDPIDYAVIAAAVQLAIVEQNLSVEMQNRTQSRIWSVQVYWWEPYLEAWMPLFEEPLTRTKLALALLEAYIAALTSGVKGKPLEVTE